MRTIHIAAVLAVSQLGCGSNVDIEDGSAGGGGNPPLPPAPAVCEEAMAAVDWTECEASSIDLERTTLIYCANQVDTPVCGATVVEYTGCLAREGATCRFDSEDGIETSFFESPGCEDELQLWLDCAAGCRGGSVCPEDAAECRCTGVREGTACCTYPHCPDDGSLPSCQATCTECSES